MTKQERFTQIARQHLGIETLETRNRDALDFHDVGVVGVARALDAAYRAGQAELLAAATALLAARDQQMVTDLEWRALQRAVKHAARDRVAAAPGQANSASPQ